MLEVLELSLLISIDALLGATVFSTTRVILSEEEEETFSAVSLNQA